MGSEWEAVRLGNYVDASLGKMLDKNKNQGTLHPYLRNKNVRWGSFEFDDIPLMKFMDNEHERYGLRYGDLVVCEGGEPGRCAIWKDEIPNMKIQKALHRIRPHSSLDGIFLHYWFCYAGKFELLEPYFTGTTIQHLTGKAIAELTIPLPPLPEQKAIAHILGSLDDKIELNRQMNATLEGMAQALFKSWFVDFDPVIDNALAAGNPIPDALADRAKVRGQALANGSANREAAAAFPAAFHFTEELGWIPEGWEISSLKDCTSKIGSGSTPRGGSSAYINEGTRLVRSQNIHDSSFRWAGIVCITDEAATKLSGVTLTEHDVLINITGDSILRTCVVDPSVLPARVNQHVAILRPKPDLPTHYLHQYIVRTEYKEYLLGFDAGGSRSAITKGHLEEAKILLPNENALSLFARMADSFFERKMKNNSQMQNLAKLRDTLLPKLISGELRIPDAEKLAEEALA